MTKVRFTRRRFMATSAAASATMVAAPFVHTAGAAGSLSMGLWDHWVPGANKAMTEICEAWAQKEKVDLKIDYLSTQGNKLYLTIAAEALARSGHDIMDFSAWEPNQYEASLEPVDDVMKEVLARNGAVGPEYEYLAKPKGKWLGVPGIRGTLFLTACSRFDLMKEHAGIDILGMYPAGAPPTKAADAWTWDAFLAAAEKCHKAGYSFGLPLGVTTDSVEWLGAFFRAFGAEIVDAQGNITVKSDPVRQALEYLNRLTQFLPPDVGAWDNASNNKALVAGKTAFIFNPPSAWAVGQTGQSAGGREAVDARYAQGAQGQVRLRAAAFPGPVELLQEQVRGQEPAGVRLHPRGRREARRRLRRLRPASLHQVQRLQDLGGGRPAQGHPLALSRQGRSGADHPVRARTAVGGLADLHPGHRAEDGAEDGQGRAHGEDARLGNGRGRGLLPQLTEAGRGAAHVRASILPLTPALSPQAGRGGPAARWLRRSSPRAGF